MNARFRYGRVLWLTAVALGAAAAIDAGVGWWVGPIVTFLASCDVELNDG